MSSIDHSDPEWGAVYAVYGAIPRGRIQVVTDTYWKMRKRNLSCTDALRQALVRHGYLNLNDGAEEYEEIMKGAGIWDSIQSD